MTTSSPVKTLTAGHARIGLCSVGQAKGLAVAQASWTNPIAMVIVGNPTAFDTLDRLDRRVQALEERGDRASVIVPIQDLEPAPVDVTKPILAVVCEEGDAFVASFVDANVNASGESQLDAIEMLKDAIASRFRIFVNEEAVLAEEPKRQLTVLRRFLRMR